MDDIWSFMGQAIKFFDETDWIMAACPFAPPPLQKLPRYYEQV